MDDQHSRTTPGAAAQSRYRTGLKSKLDKLDEQLSDVASEASWQRLAQTE